MLVNDDNPHDRLIEVFPNCEIRSAHNPNYNCVTWAIYEEENISHAQKSYIWWPNPSDECYWPDVSLDDSLEAFEKVFRELGYQVTEHQKFEPNFRKIAIYVDLENMPSHVARQITSDQDIGFWTSKCGSSHDVIHECLEDLEGEIYGTVARIMKKRIDS